MDAAETSPADTPEISLSVGAYRAVIGASGSVRDAALDLRARAFRHGAPDADMFDPFSAHGVVRIQDQPAIHAFRVRLIRTAADLHKTYTGQHYDLDGLRDDLAPFVEIGRFCQAAGSVDVMAARLAWAALAAFVDAHHARMLIGCTSLPGASLDRHHAVLATLRAHHLGPEALRPGKRSAQAVSLPMASVAPQPLPHLLQGYLNLGGWVGDHVVVDEQLDRLHVFTALRVEDIPKSRKRRLRALAQAARGTGRDTLDVASAAP